MSWRASALLLLGALFGASTVLVAQAAHRGDVGGEAGLSVGQRVLAGITASETSDVSPFLDEIGRRSPDVEAEILRRLGSPMLLRDEVACVLVSQFLRDPRPDLLTALRRLTKAADALADLAHTVAERLNPERKGEAQPPRSFDDWWDEVAVPLPPR